MNKTISISVRFPLTILFLCSFYGHDALAGFEWTPPTKIDAPAVVTPEEVFPPPAAQPIVPVESVPINQMVPVAPISANTLDQEKGFIPPYPPAVNAPESYNQTAYANQQITYRGQPLRRQRPNMAAPSASYTDSLPYSYQPSAPMRKTSPSDQMFLNPDRIEANPAAYADPYASVPVIDLYPLMKGEQPRPRGSTGFAQAHSVEPVSPESYQYPVSATNLRRPAEVNMSSSQPQYPSAQMPAIQQNEPPQTQYFKEAVGFGNEIPLALAIGQIVPPEVPYAFSENINPGIRVDWNGGKPWNKVLQDAIEPHGLSAVISDAGVMIVSANRTISSQPQENYFQPPYTQNSFNSGNDMVPMPLTSLSGY